MKSTGRADLGAERLKTKPRYSSARRSGDEGPKAGSGLDSGGPLGFSGRPDCAAGNGRARAGAPSPRTLRVRILAVETSRKTFLFRRFGRSRPVSGFGTDSGPGGVMTVPVIWWSWL